jgi:hypothetical protein
VLFHFSLSQQLRDFWWGVPFVCSAKMVGGEGKNDRRKGENIVFLFLVAKHCNAI